ncbi:uncharacterized protein LOC132734413 isoform X2 [Ruditapes philippinarum]|uniref:uncharacterized protein LOC132734413 isoform X2 n=1 Tax=Ruditapes philippinarum TaxID=129788 RepID=UPI00295BEAF8|nr:uncharacterized protein LOC132734413 isoform X2 [Ruditapes philippinarum]
MYIVILGVLWVYHFLVISVSTQSLKYKDVGNQTNFHFENCNRSATPFYVQLLKLYPDPINLQMGVMRLSIEFSLERDVGKDNNRIDVDLNWRLKTSEGYTELCDIIGENNCHFNDLCAELKKIMDRAPNTCPAFMKEKYHNNCSCPFLKLAHSTKGDIRPNNQFTRARNTCWLCTN